MITDGWFNIVSFLQQNTHPLAAERIPSVPENVTDQIRLWESDMNRVEITTAHLYDEFPSRDVYEAACGFAQELWWFALGKLEEDASSGESRYLHRNERIYPSTKAIVIAFLHQDRSNGSENTYFDRDVCQMRSEFSNGHFVDQVNGSYGLRDDRRLWRSSDS